MPETLVTTIKQDAVEWNASKSQEPTNTITTCIVDDKVREVLKRAKPLPPVSPYKK